MKKNQRVIVSNHGIVENKLMNTMEKIQTLKRLANECYNLGNLDEGDTISHDRFTILVRKMLSLYSR